MQAAKQALALVLGLQEALELYQLFRILFLWMNLLKEVNHSRRLALQWIFGSERGKCTIVTTCWLQWRAML